MIQAGVEIAKKNLAAMEGAVRAGDDPSVTRPDVDRDQELERTPETNLACRLRLSLIQLELRAIADLLDENNAQIVRYAARVLNLLR